jgi:hypothetical protein
MMLCSVSGCRPRTRSSRMYRCSARNTLLKEVLRLGVQAAAAKEVPDRVVVRSDDRGNTSRRNAACRGELGAAQHELGELLLALVSDMPARSPARFLLGSCVASPLLVGARPRTTRVGECAEYQQPSSDGRSTTRAPDPMSEALPTLERRLTSSEAPPTASEAPPTSSEARRPRAKRLPPRARRRRRERSASDRRGAADRERSASHRERGAADRERSASRPRAKRLRPEARRLTPRAKRFTPRAKRLRPRAKRLRPRAKRLRPRAKRLRPRAKRLDPERSA